MLQSLVVKTIRLAWSRPLVPTTAGLMHPYSNTSNSLDNLLVLGKTLSTQKTFSQADVDDFIAMIGDRNPIHVDAAAARSAGFEGCVIPGILLTSLFPAIIGSHIPGALYASQQVTFRHPAVVGVTLLAEVTVKKRMRDWAIFITTCKLPDGTLIAEGEAKAKLPAS